MSLLSITMAAKMRPEKKNIVDIQWLKKKKRKKKGT